MPAAGRGRAPNTKAQGAVERADATESSTRSEIRAVISETIEQRPQEQRADRSAATSATVSFGDVLFAPRAAACGWTHPERDDVPPRAQEAIAKHLARRTRAPLASKAEITTTTPITTMIEERHRRSQGRFGAKSEAGTRQMGGPDGIFAYTCLAVPQRRPIQSAHFALREPDSIRLSKLIGESASPL
jgi:hypothetical protein